MIPESLLALTFSLWAALAPQDATFTSGSRQLVDTLQALRDQVQRGALPTVEELAVGCWTRHRVLSGLDSHAAARFGIERGRMRERLVPAFLAELRQLEDHLRQQRSGAIPAPSPVLSLVLDFEHELLRNALHQLESLGLPSPLEDGQLARAGNPVEHLEPEVVARNETTPAANPPPASTTGAPLLHAEVLYAAGHYATALEEYRRAVLPEGESGFGVRYRIADCLLQTGQDAAAIQELRALVDALPGTPWAAQAEWSVAFVQAMAARRSSQSPSESR